MTAFIKVTKQTKQISLLHLQTKKKKIKNWKHSIMPEGTKADGR